MNVNSKCIAQRGRKMDYFDNNTLQDNFTDSVNNSNNSYQPKADHWAKHYKTTVLELKTSISELKTRKRTLKKKVDTAGIKLEIINAIFMR